MNPFCDYVALIAKIDAEWSRSVGRGRHATRSAFERVETDFTAACRKYSDNVSRYCREFQQSRRPPPASQEVHERCSLAPGLFRPAYFVPFGHADVIALALADDFDVLAFLPGEISTTIEDLTLSFCVAPSALCDHADSPIVRPDELIARALDDVAPERHPVPLAAFTEFRLDALGLLANGLLFQSAVMEAMCATVRDVWIRGSRAAWRTAEPQPSDTAAEDFRASRMALLDGQASAEVITVTLCNNFSVAAAYLTALRRLTYADVLRTKSGRILETVLGDSHLHRKVWELNHPGSRTRTRYNARAFDDNHVFRWTNTTLGVISSVLWAAQRPGCHGWIDARCDLQVPPGHISHVQDAFQHLTTPPSPPQSVCRWPRLHMGYCDLELPYTRRRVDSLLAPTADVIASVAANLEYFGARVRPKNARHVTDFITSVAVPVPLLATGSGAASARNSWGAKIGTRHWAPLISLLPRLRDSLFEEAAGSSGEVATPTKFRRQELRNGMRRAGIPVALRRSIETFYEELFKLLADPFLFDTFLDLYDASATFYAVLARHLPTLMAPDQSGGSSVQPTLDAARTLQLAEFLDTLNNALGHRLSRSYMQSQLRDASLHFKGGLTQFVLAADAPLKAALGLVRRMVLGKAERRDTVGAVTRISATTGLRCQRLNLGVDDAAYLAWLEGSVAHVLHPPSYAEYVHEALHLAFDACAHRDSFDLHKIPFPKIAELMSATVSAERISELFVLLLFRLCLFGNDRHAFLLSHLASFARSHIPTGTGDHLSTFQTAEILLRLYLAYQTYEDADWPGVLGTPGHQVPSILDPNADSQALLDFVSLCRPFIWDGDQLWADGKSPGFFHLQALLAEVIPSVKHCLPWVWDQARAIHNAFRDTLVNKDDYAAAFVSHVEQTLSEGIPINVQVATIPGTTASLPLDGDGIVDPLVVTCRVLQAYLGRIKQAEGLSVLAFRSNPGLRINYADPRSKRPWYEFQCDKAASAMFCCIPEARQARLRQHVALLKTFWNLSSVFRSRRFLQLIEENL